ncbi:MarR family winged helix-turn-helix transcriptional regulator [Rhizomonospora bruguierae]|uniref:MarR family winged helix-turn-helix transcriptional regulator n=1 Tax=Rhizomonospora bruguierae TaxID=1581705 RepID=UPI0020BF17FD|nr:MarR family transcriptional regulator [Micromonospora sp. NBRC 107566]
MTEASSDRAPTPAASAAARDLAVLFRRLRARMRQLPMGGLTPSQTSVLLRLDKDGASSNTLLALAEGVRSQSMTATLNTLEQRGLIERSPDPEDGRRQIITLSEAGLARVSHDRQGRRDWLAQSMDERFTADQLATINEALALLGELADR